VSESSWLNDQDVKVPTGVPVPTLWRVLVMPVQPRRMSRGTSGVSIALPDATQDSEGYLNYIGKVVLLGPLAGKNDKFENPDWARWKEALEHAPDTETGGKARMNPVPRWLWGVKEGDWVIYGRYAGQRMEFEGVKLVMTNDDEILGVVADPSGFRIYA
jgi:hypothetical protein